MSAKSKTTKRKSQGWTHKSIRNEMERSITLMVLSHPNLEHEIVSNYLNRNGYVMQSEDDSDKRLYRIYGIPLPSKKELALRKIFKDEAEKLYKLSQKMRAENKAHTAKKKALKPVGLSKKDS